MHKASIKKEKQNRLWTKEVMKTQNTVYTNYSGKGDASFRLHILKQTFPKYYFGPFVEMRKF